MEAKDLFKDGGEGALVNNIEMDASSYKIGPVVMATNDIEPFISLVYKGEDIYTNGKNSG